MKIKFFIRVEGFNTPPFRAGLLICFLFFVFAAGLGAQTVHDPNSQIYKDIDNWTVRGYIKEFLPIIRPYPAQLIDKILDEVISNGDSGAREKAEKYREATKAGSRPIHPGVLGYIEGDEEDVALTGAPFAEGIFRITDFLSASYNFSIYGISDEEGERFNVPGTYTPYPDFISDVASIGPFEIRQDWTSLMALGTDSVYFQAGLSRTSFGPFYDNSTVVGPQAPRAGHFSFVFWRPKWSVEVLFQTLTATNDFGEGKFSEKYNIIHTFVFRPLKNLELGFMEALVWGKRFEFLYLVPFSYLFASQSMYGFDDNSFMGFHIRWRPIDTFLVNGQLFIDDFPFKNIFSGNQKYKIAGELGLSWAPREGFLSKLDFDYTAVFPYMYTHWSLPEGDMYNPAAGNYLNYTHLGKNLGADLEPNSDRFSLRSSWNFHPDIILNVSAYFTRHGNASEGRDRLNIVDTTDEEPKNDKPHNDGTIFDDGVANDNKERNPYEDLRFLTQDVIDTRLGGSLGVTWTLPIPSTFGVLKISGEYGAKYGWNRELVADDNGVNHFWSLGGMWSW